MATTEKRVDKLETRFTTLEQQVATVAAKVDMVIGEIQQQREDMRRLQDRQDAAQAKHDTEMHEMNQRFYEKVDSINKEFAKELHSNFVQTMIGVGAMIVVLGGILIAALK